MVILDATWVLNFLDSLSDAWTFVDEAFLTNVLLHWLLCPDSVTVFDWGSAYGRGGGGGMASELDTQALYNKTCHGPLSIFQLLNNGSQLQLDL